jgi:hypothetical protein
LAQKEPEAEHDLEKRARYKKQDVSIKKRFGIYMKEEQNLKLSVWTDPGDQPLAVPRYRETTA